MTTIYGLDDPRDGRLRYVGRTGQPLGQRLAGHLLFAAKYRSRAPLQRWLRELLGQGLAPTLRPLLVVSDALADEAERGAIASYPDLLNVTHNLAALAGGAVPR